MRGIKLGLAVCIVAMTTGCISVGNTSWEDLSEEDKREVAEALDEAKEAVAGVTEEVRAELEQINWAEVLLEGNGGRREEKLIFYSGKEEGISVETEDRETLFEALSFEDWQPVEEETAGLTVAAGYVAQQKKSMGLLDRHKEKYWDLGSIMIYEDTNLVRVRVDFFEDTVGRATRKLLHQAGEDWFEAVYQVPEGDLELLLNGGVKK